MGSKWSEIIVNLFLFILVGPLFLFLITTAWLWGVVGLILNLPKPKQIPVVIQDSETPPNEIAEIYVQKLRELFPNITIEENSLSSDIRVINSNTEVSLWQDDNVIGILMNKVDSGFWHTGEEDNIDIFFWYAVAALRNGIQYKTSRFGRKEGWVYSSEMGIWMGVSTSIDLVRYSYCKYSRKF